MCHFYSLRQISLSPLRVHRYAWQQSRYFRLQAGEAGQVLRGRSKGTVEFLTWGFRSAMPGLPDKPLIGAEIVAERPASANAFRRQRCLVFADGFYIGNGNGIARRYFFFQRPDHQPFAFAGIWHQAVDGARNDTFAILTCPANAIVGSVHERMPVILGQGFHDAWHDDSYSDVAALKRMLRPWSDRLLEDWEVRSDLRVRSTMDYGMVDAIGPKLRARKRKPSGGMLVVT